MILLQIGTVDITENSWILCPKGEKEKIAKDNPNVYIIEYEGENVTGYADFLLSAMGYKQEKGGKWNWTDEKAENKFNEIMKKEGFEIAAHVGTKDKVEEDLLERINKSVAIFSLIKRNGLIKNKQDIKSIKEQLNIKDIKVLLDNTCIDIERRVSIFYEQLAKEQIIIPLDLKMMISNILSLSKDTHFTDIVPNDIETKEEHSNTIEELKTKIEEYKSDYRIDKNDVIADLIQESVLIGIEESREKEQKLVKQSIKDEEQL